MHSSLQCLGLIGQLLLILASAGAAHADTAPRKLAVLELENRANLSPAEADYLTDQVRGVATRLPGILVMTRENITELLPPGKNLAACYEGHCDVEIGRNLGADYLAVGQALKFGARLKITLKLYGVAQSNQMAQQTATADTLEALEPALITAADALFKATASETTAPHTFGSHLPPLDNQAEAIPEAKAPPVGGTLAEVNFEVLQAFEQATVTEQSSQASSKEKARAWARLAGLTGVDAEMRAEAQRRANHWRAVQQDMNGQCARLKSVSARFKADRRKLEGLLKLKDSTLSKAKKVAFQKEFDEAYDPWRGPLETFEADCRLFLRMKASGIRMVKLDAGRFKRGSKSGQANERPVRVVRLKGFKISRSEITVAQYQRCVERGVCTSPILKDKRCNWGRTGRSTHPINCLNWHQARRFAEWMGARLPTETEWEYAARGRGASLRYPWGGKAPSCKRAIFDKGGNGCGRNRTWPVCKRPSGHTRDGLCDMAGNVQEWVEDTYADSYRKAPTDGSAHHQGGDKKVHRGGGWFSVPSHLTTTRREAARPDDASPYVGFRIAQDLN